jgi:hypothetical protein
VDSADPGVPPRMTARRAGHLIHGAGHLTRGEVDDDE